MVLVPLLLAAATAFAAPGGLQAAQAPLSGLQVTPPKFEQDLKGRTFNLEVSFRNNTEAIVSPTFEIAGLGHDLDGQPLLPPPPPALSSLRLSPTSVRLAPNEASRLTLRGQVPPGAGGVYAGVVATVAPPDGAGTGVDVTQRLASLVLLRGPKPWNESLAVETVGARPTVKDTTVEVFAQLRNTGNVHVRPTGSVKVVHSGRTLATIELKPDVVIPGYARRVGGPWRVPTGLEGTVSLEAAITGPGPPASATGTAIFRNGKLVVPPGGPGIRPGTGIENSAGATLENEDSGSDSGRVVLSIIGALLLLALLIGLGVVARRRRDQAA